MKDIVLEGYEEHHVIDLVVNELSDLPTDAATWAAKLSVIKENVEHHIEEEEGEMFKTARTLFERGELEQLGTRLEARKKQLQAEATEELARKRDALCMATSFGSSVAINFGPSNDQVSCLHTECPDDIVGQEEGPGGFVSKIEKLLSPSVA